MTKQGGSSGVNNAKIHQHRRRRAERDERPPTSPTSAKVSSLASADEKLLPWSHYDDLRRSPLHSFAPLVGPDGVTRGAGRNLHLVVSNPPPPGESSEAAEEDGGNAEAEADDLGKILCHVPAFFRWTSSSGGGEDVSNSGAYDGSAAAMLAIRHFNGGDGSVVDELEGIDDRCPIRLTTELIDSTSKDRVAVHHLTELVTRPPDDVAAPQPCAVLGSSWSSVTSKMATVTGVYGIPQVTGSASSPVLDNPAEYPLFARTHPSDSGMARLSMSYLSEVLGVRFFGIAYVENAFGVSYYKEILRFAEEYNMTFESVSFPPDSDRGRIRSALEPLIDTGFNYFLGVFYNAQYESVMDIAGELGIAGPGRFWLFNGLLTASFVEGSTTLEKDSFAAKATYGNAILHDEGGLPGLPQYDRFIAQWKNLANDQDGINYINSKQPSHDTISFNRTSDFFLGRPGHIASFSYDAIVSLGLAACAALNSSGARGEEIFSGSEHHSNLIATSFFGATGNVSIGPGSFSRGDESTYFVISNILNVSEEEGGSISFRGSPWSVFDTGEKDWIHYGDGASAFVYSDGSAVAPKDIPEQNEDLHHLRPAVRGICLALCLVAICLSIAFSLYTFVKRKHRVMLASQPPFCHLLCLGTLLMASAIIPASFDDSVISEHGCDIACMSVYWLAAIGFCCSFSAIYSKLRRINKLFKNAKGFKRVKVEARDVILPFIALLSCNIVILAAWTAVSPLEWERTTLQYDPYGRPAESIGQCVSERAAPFIGPLLAVNGLALILALWQAYVARGIETEFSESKYIAMATVCIFQALFIGVPVILFVSSQPTVKLFIFSGIDFIVCMSILLLVFIPKVSLIRKGDRGLPRGYSARGTNWIVSRHARASDCHSAGEESIDVHSLRQENIELRKTVVTLRHRNSAAMSVADEAEQAFSPECSLHVGNAPQEVNDRTSSGGL